MTDSDDIRRKRLLFRSWHRGTKEADLLLGSFAERHLAAFTPEQVARSRASFTGKYLAPLLKRQAAAAK